MSRFAGEAHDVSRAIGDREGEALALHTIANGLVYTFRVGDVESYYLRALELYARARGRRRARRRRSCSHATSSRSIWSRRRWALGAAECALGDNAA